MLGRHVRRPHFQPVIEAIIKLAEKAGEELRELSVADNAALEKKLRDLIEGDLRADAGRRQDGSAQGARRREERSTPSPVEAGEIVSPTSDGRLQRARSRTSCAGHFIGKRIDATLKMVRNRGRGSAYCRGPTARRCSPARRSLWLVTLVLLRRRAVHHAPQGTDKDVLLTRSSPLWLGERLYRRSGPAASPRSRPGARYRSERPTKEEKFRTTAASPEIY